jgi:aspartate dehydrogenase
MEETTTVFEGTATDAATAFPSNINVALALSLAARVDPDETTVRIVATPNSANNVHQVRVTGEAGSIETKVQNVPSPTNPQTSYLAVLSAIETLRSITIPFSVGT